MIAAHPSLGRATVSACAALGLWLLAACGSEGPSAPPALDVVVDATAGDLAGFDTPPAPDGGDAGPGLPELPDMKDASGGHDTDHGGAPDTPPEDTPKPDAPVPDTRPDVPPADLETADGDVARDVGPDAEPSPVAAQIAECRHWLAQGQPYLALQAAEAGLAIAPDDTDALFCAALAGLIDRTEFGLSMLTLLDMAQTYAGSIVEPTWSDYVAGEIHRVAEYLHEGFARAVVRLDRLDGRSLAFDVDAAWVYSGSRPFMVLRGRFDAGDVRLMRVIGTFAMGFLDILRGQDFRGDAATLISYIVDDFMDQFNVPNLLRIVAYMVVTDERFLGLDPLDGPDAFAEARTVLERLGPELRQTLETMAAQPAVAGVAEVSTCEELPNGGYRLRVHMRVDTPTDPELPLEEAEMRFTLDPAVLDGVDAVSASVANPGTLVSFEGGVRYVLALMVSALLDGGVLGELEVAGIRLKPGTFSTAQLAGILSLLIEAPAAFDLGTFYATPVGLRALLPESVAAGGFGADHMLSEWECPGDLGPDGLPQGWQRFLCGEGAEFVDSAHFVDTPFALEPDGYVSPLPYFAWRDPTLGGLLYVDLSGVFPEQEPGFVPTDGSSVNILLAESLKNLLSALGK